MELSKLQLQCIDNILSWYSGSTTNQTFVLSGVAGSGKTTLVAHIRNILPKTIRVAFSSFTGKAASVLRNKLSKFGLQKYSNDTISTIHALIYEPMKNEETDNIEDMKWILKSSLDIDLIIVDESSMVPKQIYDELLSFGKKILFVGDAFQLPPVDDDFNLLGGPIDFKLHEVHRFAEKNPLTKVSMLARLEGYIPHGKYGDNVIKVKKNHSLITDFINFGGDFSDTAILCGFNQTRVEVNKKIRNWYKREGDEPKPGEKVICLKNNAHSKFCPIYNGVTGIIRECQTRFDHLYVKISIDGEEKNYIGKISKNIFNNKNPDMSEWIFEETYANDANIDRFITERKTKQKRVYLDCFDFGYTLTVHKSQGSEWDRVMLLEQPCQYWSGPLWNRWLYTGVTRSKNELLIVR